MSRIAVVIVNFNTKDLLKRCLEHVLQSQTEASISIYVVDNGSTDGTADLVRERFPEVTLILSRDNVGFSRANNLALRSILSDWQAAGASTCDVVLLLNSDCFVEADTLQLTLDYLRSRSEVGIVGPKVLLRDGSLDLACRRSFPRPSNALWKLTGLAKIFPGSPRFASYNLTYLDPDATAEVDSVMGAYMMVRLAAVHEAGLLDESFFMYGEDLDWAFRIKSHGWRVVYFPEAKVLHYKGATSAKQSNRLIIEFYRAMYLFHQKHYSNQSYRVVNWLIWAGIITRGAFALVRNAFRPASRKRVA